MWSRRVALVASLTVSMVPAPSRASFHDAVINEVMAGVGGNANAQFVEIRMLAGFQNAVAGSRLTWFNCTFTSCQVLMQVGPFNVPNSGPGVTWLMASPNDATFSAATGVHADYYWDNAVTGNLDPSCGMVCWGAPGVVVPNPATWDPGEPNNYTDCVAYGGYTGRRKTLPSYLGGPTSGTPSNLTAGNGMQRSLTRVTNTNDNLDDFDLRAKSPVNNCNHGAGCTPQTPMNPGVCTPATTPIPTTTTSTTTTTATTSSTTTSSAAVTTTSTTNGSPASSSSTSVTTTLPTVPPSSTTTTITSTTTTTATTSSTTTSSAAVTTTSTTSSSTASSSSTSVTTTSTTLPSLATSSTTTTTRPCPTPRCAVEAVVQGPACRSDTIPSAVRRKLDRAPELLEQAETSPPGKARALRKKAKRLLKRAGGSALRASRGKKPKLSAGCAASIKETTDQLAGDL